MAASRMTAWMMAAAAGAATATSAGAAGTSLTVYNGGFGVVRETFPITLRPGENKVVFADATAQVEASSVILRDAAGKIGFNILEQNYRNDPASQERLLEFYEGQTIDFVVGRNDDGSNKVVKGKIVRSGYTPQLIPLAQSYGGYQPPMYGAGQPIIEVNGQLMFGLPGQPLFPALSDDAILRPTLEWTIASRAAAQTTAEVGYVTGGMTWNADYNIVAPETGSQVDLLGWVTVNNQTGKSFTDAKIQLMAGDVHRVQPQDGRGMYPAAARMMEMDQQLGVTEKAFDEYHLYTVERKATLRDAETKQIEFVRGEDVKAEKIFVYDGASQGPGHRWHWGGWRNDQPGYMNNDQAKVWIMREFENTKENGLGIPLPAGKLRFYTQDTDGTLQFVGENMIDHTPQGETVRVYTGNAFDLVGERKQTNFETTRRSVRETIEITLRNRKEERAEIRVVEHMYRWTEWSIEKNSMPFEKTDAQTIEFRVMLDPDEEKVITYTAFYSW